MKIIVKPILKLLFYFIRKKKGQYYIIKKLIDNFSSEKIMKKI